jgi:hypothetical protein
MSGPKRNPDKLNTIGVVVVGVCGAVMVYVTIVALQAFYMNDTSELQTMADYGGQDTTAKSHKADEMRNITEAASNGVAPGTPQTYRIRIDHAMELVVRDAKDHPDHLVPLLPEAVTPTVKPIFDRGQPLETPVPATPPAEGAGSGAPPEGAGSGAPTAPTGAGSAAPAAPAGAGSAAPTTPAAPPAATPTPRRPAATPRPAAPVPAPVRATTPTPPAGSAAGGHAP